MMKSTVTVAVAAALGLAGCAGVPQKVGISDNQAKTVAASAIGCVGGAIMARLSGGNLAAGCAVGAIVGGLIGFEQARQTEIAEAEKIKQEAVAALSTLPKNQPAKVSDVKTVEVTAIDKVTKEEKKYQAFDSVSVEIPLSAKGTREREMTIAKLKTLAEKVADERGTSSIIIAMTPADAKLQKADLTTTVVKTAKGNDIAVTKVADANVPKGNERITIKAGKLTTEV